MKKTIITLMACVALGAACGAAEDTEKSFGLEVNGSYNFALRDIASDIESGSFKIDTYGLDLTAIYRISKHHSVNVRFGWSAGEHDEDYYVYDVFCWNTKVEVTNITIMPGYRFTTAVSDSMDFFCGVNAGLVRTEVELTVSDYFESVSAKGNEWNLAWSAEVGISQKVSANSKLTCAVMLQGLYAQPSRVEYDSGYKTDNQLHLGVRAGYTCQF